MTNQQCHGGHDQKKRTRIGHGPSSFWLHNPEQIFPHLGVGDGATFVDAGCGAGEYSLYAAKLVGDKGRVISMDSAESSINGLHEEAQRQNLDNITGKVCDICAPLPLESGCADIVLLFTVLHIPAVRRQSELMFQEFHRVLRPGGCLAVIDCKKQEANFGPPKHMRLSEEEVEAMVEPSGFKKNSALDLGHTYLLCFQPHRP